MNDKTEKNLIFIGMMGVGKTTVGKECARIMNRKFYDTDEIYEKNFGSIESTFKAEGESVFRHRESAIIEQLSQLRGVVIATGGGAVLSDKFETPAKTGMVIWLCAAPEILSIRIKANTPRPLNKGIESLSKMLISREALYKKYADVIIDTNNSSVSDIVASCLKGFLN